MMPNKPRHDGRTRVHDLRDQEGSLSFGFVTFGMRLLITVAVIGASFVSYRLFGGAGLYIFSILFFAWWLHRELSWIERNVPPEG